jgi:hypothetical protein
MALSIQRSSVSQHRRSGGAECRHTIFLQKRVQNGGIKFARLQQHFMMKLGSLGDGTLLFRRRRVWKVAEGSWLHAA